MKLSAKPLASLLYKAWLRSRLDDCSRNLASIAAQRANDEQAERLLQTRMLEMRSKLRALN